MDTIGGQNAPSQKHTYECVSLNVPAEILFLESKLVGLINSDAGRNALTGALHYDDDNEYEEISDNEGDEVHNNEYNYKKDGMFGQELYKEYVAYCREWGFSKEPCYQKNIKAFYSKLADYELPIEQKKIHNQIKYFQSIILVLKKYLTL